MVRMRSIPIGATLSIAVLLLAGGAARADYESEVMLDQPFAYWRLNEDAGPTAKNLGTAGAALDLIYGATVIFEELSVLCSDEDLAAAFNGIDAEIHIPDHSLINTGGPYAARSIELWFRAEMIDLSPRVLYEEGGGTRGLNIYLLEVDGEPRIYMHGWNRDTAQVWWEQKYVYAPIEAGEAYHAVLVLDGSDDGVFGDLDGRITGYLNGSPIGTAEGVDRLYGHGNDGCIGGIVENTRFHDNSTLTDGGNVEGTIDEVALYSFPLDDPNDDGDREDSRILDHYLAGCPVCAIGLAAERDGGSVRLTWILGAGKPETVRVVRDGKELAAAAPADPPVFVDVAPPVGILSYELTFTAAGATCSVLRTLYDGCISGLTAKPTCEDIALAWSNGLPYEKIEIRRSDGVVEEAIATIDGKEESYLDKDVSPGTWTYSVAPAGGACDRTSVTIQSYPCEPFEPWISEDIGNTLSGGIEKEADDACTIYANGDDIWNQADAFRFTYREFEGDFEIIAQVESLDDTNAWAKAGLMARESTSPGSRYAFIHVTPAPGGERHRLPVEDRRRRFRDQHLERPERRRELLLPDLPPAPPDREHIQRIHLRRRRCHMDTAPVDPGGLHEREDPRRDGRDESRAEHGHERGVQRDQAPVHRCLPLRPRLRLRSGGGRRQADLDERIRVRQDPDLPDAGGWRCPAQARVARRDARGVR